MVGLKHFSSLWTSLRPAAEKHVLLSRLGCSGVVRPDRVVHMVERCDNTIYLNSSNYIVGKDSYYNTKNVKKK